MQRLSKEDLRDAVAIAFSDPAMGEWMDYLEMDIPNVSPGQCVYEGGSVRLRSVDGDVGVINQQTLAGAFPKTVDYMKHCYTPEDSEFDAEYASVLLQFALFGECIYG